MVPNLSPPDRRARPRSRFTPVADTLFHALRGSASRVNTLRTALGIFILAGAAVAVLGTWGARGAGVVASGCGIAAAPIKSRAVAAGMRGSGSRLAPVCGGAAAVRLEEVVIGQ